MDENLHNIEDLFYSSLNDNTEEIPSENVWEGIDKHLDKDKIIRIRKGYTRLKRISIILLLLLGIAVYKLQTYPAVGINDQENKHDVASNQKGTNQKAVSKTSSKEQDLQSKWGKEVKTVIDKNEQILINNSPVNEVQSKDGNMAASKKKNQSTRQNMHHLDRLTQKYISGEVNPLKGRQYKTAIELNTISVKINRSLVKGEPMSVDIVEEQDGFENSFLRKINYTPLKINAMPTSHSTDINQLPLLAALSETNFIKAKNNLFAKSGQRKKSGAGRFSLTPFFSPDVVWYHLEDDKPTIRRENAREIERDENHEFSYTLGILVDYNLGKHWGLQSGLTYANNDITTRPQTIYAQSDNAGNVKYRINTSSGYGYVLPSFSNSPNVGDSLFAFTATHSLQYFSLPLAITYSLTRGKIKLSALAGVSTNILMKARLDASIENGNYKSIEAVDNLQGIKKFYFSGLTGVSINYKLSKKASLVFAPVFRFALNSINQAASVKSFPMSIGFTTGIKVAL